MLTTVLVLYPIIRGVSLGISRLNSHVYEQDVPDNPPSDAPAVAAQSEPVPGHQSASNGGAPQPLSSHQALLDPATARTFLKQNLASVSGSAALRLSRQLDSLVQQRASPAAVESWVQQVERAKQWVAERAARVPPLTFDSQLPIAAEREAIKKLISDNQVIVLCGETGSGKTTQLPKMLLELGRGTRGFIGHTQPRRIAARSVAQRIASEIGTQLGSGLVGFKVRFGDETDPGNLIKLMTDGILLAETQRDRALLAYDTIIIDEAHERSLNIDFLLGYLRTLLPRRPDLKVIVTSATIDPQRFAAHFADKQGKPAPIMMVGGRAYPVELRYCPPADEHIEWWDETDDNFFALVRDQLDALCSQTQGDVLMFLSGEREIREVAESLARYRPPTGEKIEVLPLYAKLSAEEQQRVFARAASRRIVLATNVAETSITVPGIRSVIDPGFARVNRYSPKTKVDRLEVELISQASANQRAGRCGRVGPGICVRLYSEEDFTARQAFGDPEIHRENLANVILQMAALQLGKVEDFPFVDPPDARGIKDGYDTLQELGAIHESGKLTETGRRLARLPIDPRLARIILAGAAEHALRETIIIASALSIQDPRERPAALQDKADAAHERFEDADSDFLGLLKLWREWRTQRRDLGGSKLRKWCKENFLSFVRLREWEDLHEQLLELARELKLRENREPAKRDAIHKALLAGLLCNVGCKLEKQDVDRELGNYAGGRSNKFFIHPGSALSKSGPKWLFAAEVVRTTRTFARTIAPCQPEWIELVGAHLIKKSYTEPRWERHAGRVIAMEKGTLNGLEVYSKRRVHFGEINPKESREIFVHHALVHGEMERPPPQLRANIELEERVKELEQRCRRHHLLCDYDKRFRYYDSRVPAEIVTAGQFEKWRFEATKANPRLLCMSLEDLLADGITLPPPHAFPDELDLGPLKLPLQYVHDAGNEADGVTMRVPLDALGQVPQERLAWLVPGHLAEKIDTILRGLPKDYRRLLPAPAQLVPQAVDLMAPAVTPSRAAKAVSKENFYDTLRLAILTAAQHEVPREILAAVPCPLWMTLRLEVLDENNKVIAAGRDANQLRSLLSGRVRSGLVASAAAQTRKGIKHWDFGDLPERIELDRGGMKFGAFPGIVDDRDSVSLQLFDTFDASQAATRHGSRRLFMLSAVDALRRHATSIPGLDQASLHFASLGSASALRAQVQELIADRAFIGDMLPVRTEKEFAFRVSRGLEKLPAAVAEVAPVVAAILSHSHDVRRELSLRHPAPFDVAINDMRDQLLALVPHNFAAVHPFDWLRHVPRYVQAIRMRLQRLPGGGVMRDAKLMEEVTPFVKGLAELQHRQQALGLSPIKIQELRWHIEEFRVQLFAQELRTAFPVSSKRLQEMWNAIVKG